MRFVYDYHAGIDWIVRETGQTDKFTHVQAGLIIWSLAVLVAGRRLGTAIPLIVVGLVEVANEVMDRLYLGRWNWPDTITDAVATWIWPLILSLLLAIERARREGGIDRFRRPVRRPPARHGIRHNGEGEAVFPLPQSSQSGL